MILFIMLILTIDKYNLKVGEQYPIYFYHKLMVNKSRIKDSGQETVKSTRELY